MEEYDVCGTMVLAEDMMSCEGHDNVCEYCYDTCMEEENEY